jgi:hypothetical protein
MDQFFSVLNGVLVAVLIAVMAWGWQAGQPSVSDIGKPCRHHGGVAQYVPKQHGISQWEGAFVICRDGKVGAL